MSVHAIKEAERMRVSHAQRGAPMDAAMRRGELLVACGFMLAALALPVLYGVHPSLSLPTAGLYVLAFAVAGHVRFDVGAGFTVPTQAVFVPMLFALPISLVPLLVLLALTLDMAPRIISGRVSPSWLLTVPGNSWFAWGPALVLLAAHDHNPDGRWGILLLALAAQLACDFAQTAVRERHFDSISIAELLKEVKPIYAIDLALSALGLAIAFATSPVHGQWPLLLVAPLFWVLWVFSKERHERLAQLAELNDAYQGTALLLGDVVEADDSYTGEHCKSVVRLALDVADELGLDADARRNVEFGALLHDVGKIAVPNEIINKPGELDEREWAVIKTHTIEGQRMLEKIGGFMREIGRIVRSSHERWDGSGYPDGLSGEAIPLEARIVAACDAFNAMTTTRSYREAMPRSEAIAELERCSGSHFDPEVVGGLLRTVSRSADPASVAPTLSPSSAPDDAPAPDRGRSADEAPALTAAPPRGQPRSPRRERSLGRATR
jgi:putative nucleotidyltransferase with HDIG domain